MKLRPVAECDKALKHIFDETTGELYEPTVPPEVPGWGEDGDDADAD